LVAASVAVVFIGAVTFVGVTQRSAQLKQQAAAWRLVDMERPAQSTMTPMDDPLQDRSDSVLAALEGG